jgi:hypothetical protein
MCDCMRDVYVGIVLAVVIVGVMVFTTVWNYMMHNGRHLFIDVLITVSATVIFIIAIVDIYESCKMRCMIRKRYNL